MLSQDIPHLHCNVFHIPSYRSLDPMSSNVLTCLHTYGKSMCSCNLDSLDNMLSQLYMLSRASPQSFTRHHVELSLICHQDITSHRNLHEMSESKQNFTRHHVKSNLDMLFISPFSNRWIKSFTRHHVKPICGQHQVNP